MVTLLKTQSAAWLTSLTYLSSGMVPEFEPVEITAYNDQSIHEEEEEDDGDVDDDDDEFNDVEEITDEVLNSSLNSGT